MQYTRNICRTLILKPNTYTSLQSLDLFCWKHALLFKSVLWKGIQDEYDNKINLECENLYFLKPPNINWNTQSKDVHYLLMICYL